MVGIRLLKGTDSMSALAGENRPNNFLCAGVSGELGLGLGLPFPSLTISESNTGILYRKDLWPDEKEIKDAFNLFNKEITDFEQNVPKMSKIQGDFYRIQVCATKDLGNEQELKTKYPNTKLIMHRIDGFNKYFLDIPFKSKEAAESYIKVLLAIADFDKNDEPFVTQFDSNDKPKK